MVRVRMDGLLRKIYKTSITTNTEISCLDAVSFTLADYLLTVYIMLSWCYQWHQVMDTVRSKGSIVSGARYQWCL